MTTREEGRDGSNAGARDAKRAVSRRDLLKNALVAGVGLTLADVLGPAFAQADATTETDPTKLPPQKGDVFVFAGSQNKGKVITDDDVPLGGPQVLAWPAVVSNKDGTPTVEVVRDGNTQNAVLLARFALGDYSPDTKSYVTASGVVAYSATCTHQCCQVTEWLADQKSFHCPCHGSIYDPLNHAQQTPDSPAPRPLPQLPLMTGADEAAIPTAAAGFRTQVGCGPVTH